MIYKDLYKPNLYFDDPKVDMYCKRKGFIKKKAEGLRDHLGLNTGSDKVYFCLQQRGRILSFYSDTPKKGGELQGIIRVSKIVDLQDAVKGKKGHFVIKMSQNEMLHLKCDDPKESADWVKTIQFFKDYYHNEKNNEAEAMTADIDIELKIKLQAEVELENWEAIASKFDYSSFIKDKGLTILFENNIVELLKNRLLIASAQKDIRNKKDVVLGEPQSPTTPQTPMTPSRKLDRFNLGALSSSQYFFVMICQRPLYMVDQEFALTDDVILDKASLPDWMEFNTMYYYSYSAKGDITPYQKAFEVS